MNVCGVVIGLPSTVTKPEPVKVDVIVIETLDGAKFAVSVIGSFIETCAICVGPE
jgi:hypothetical protein